MTERVLALLAVGAVGGLFARNLRLPGGSFLGALVAAGSLSVAMPNAQPLPMFVKSVALVILGISTGLLADRESLQRVGKLLVLTEVLALILIAVSIGLGFILHRIWAQNGPSLGTVLAGMLPGGASGMVAIADDLEADVPLVAAIHMLRQLIVFGLLPAFLRHVAGRTEPRGTG